MDANIILKLTPELEYTLFIMSKNNEFPVAFYNGPIVTTNGLYRISEISIEQVGNLIKKYEIISAIGHQATSDILSGLFGMPIPVNRIQFKQEPGQKAIALVLNQRPAEGRILSEKEMKSIGFTLKLIERLE